MSNMNRKLEQMRDGLSAVSTAIQAIADENPKISGNIEMKALNGSVSNIGVIWTGEGNTRQLTQQQDRLFSSNSIDVGRDNNYRINNRSVLSSSTLGPEVFQSSLTSVGTLENLSTAGSLTVDDFVYYNADTMRLGLGIDSPNGALSIGSTEHEFVVDNNDVGAFKIGAWTTSELSIITDDTTRIHIAETGRITLNDKVKVDGKLGVNVTNVSADVDMDIAGAVRFDGKKMSSSTSEPIDGSHKVGDIVWNSTPRPTGYVGWICIREGTPGEWKPFGPISS
tara:strand:+ start:284 stop:1126 length:843 start_codon:yes stop_codon:yes gene_type:complete